jgi:hypothetical protein
MTVDVFIIVTWADLSSRDLNKIIFDFSLEVVRSGCATYDKLVKRRNRFTNRCLNIQVVFIKPWTRYLPFPGDAIC